MKQIKSTYNSNTQELFGKITLGDRSIFKRSSCILVTNGKSTGKGYKAVISTQEAPHSMCAPYVQVDSIADFNEGDVVNIATDGEICFLYEKALDSNAIFATARCNHRCIMCPQPPILQENDRTPFNIELIKLFDKDTKEVGITGGEPTVIGDKLFELIRQIKKSCPKASISLLTNGVKFSDVDYAAKLAECNHHDLQIDVPIFSDIAAEHNRIVGAKTFYKTVQGLYHLALFGLQIGLRIVVHKQTYKRLPQLADYIYHNFPFVTQVAFMQMETTGLAQTNLKDLWIDPHDYNDELCKAVFLLHNRGITTYIYNAQLCVLPEELRSFAKQSISEWKDVYLPECEECSLKNECGGLFASNLGKHSKYIKPKLKYTPMPAPICGIQTISHFVENCMEKVLRLYSDPVIYDVPCGYGRHSQWLVQKGYKVVAVDLDSKALQYLKEWKQKEKTFNLTVRKADIEKSSRTESCDIVLNVHLYSSSIMDSVINMLKPGGTLIVETPQINGGNALELPLKGELYSRLLADFEIKEYEESHEKEGHVAVKLIARKKSL